MPRVTKAVATNKNNIKISINTAKPKRTRRRAPAPAPRAPVQPFFHPRQIEYIHTTSGVPPVQPKVEPPIQRPVLLPLHTNTGVPQRSGIHPIRTETQSVGVGHDTQHTSTGTNAFFNPNDNSDARNKELI